MKTFLLAAAAWFLAGCASPLPSLQIGPDPADFAAPVAAPVYAPVTAGTASYRPVEPKSWPDMNERVAPGGRRSP